MREHELESAHGRHRELLREAENGRLARRLREERRRSVPPVKGRMAGLWGLIGAPFLRI